MTSHVITGDCLTVMAAMPAASVDAIVTDPPYGLEFMGKEWDGADGFRRSLNVADVGRDTPHGRASRTSPEYRAGRLFGKWCELWATEALRVLKPGGHLLAFGGTRTYHRLACAIEDAGFEIRDTLAWMYGSGFPKSLDVSKAIDKAAGAARDVVGMSPHSAPRTADMGYHGNVPNEGERLITAPATPDAEQWNGWGTALKPAHEPIVLARKPLTGTVAANVLTHGTGGLNVDACRIEGERGNGNWKGKSKPDYDGGWEAAENDENASGRWPANVILDSEAAALLDAQTGTLTSGSGQRRPTEWQSINAYGFSQRPNGASDYERDGDSGGASRFFYVAKASSAERNAGLDIDRNVHPTVKPIDLMRWLTRLITPPGGLVLDPFTGSGTTGIACHLEGFQFTGIERDPQYAEIARARIAWWAQRDTGDTDAILQALQDRDADQLDLFTAPPG